MNNEILAEQTKILYSIEKEIIKINDNLILFIHHFIQYRNELNESLKHLIKVLI